MNMKLPYTRVQVKHLSIPANQTLYAFDNVFTGALLDLVVIGLVDDADSAGGYQRQPFNFQTFCVNRVVLMRNGTAVPREGYQLDQWGGRGRLLADVGAAWIPQRR